jgi:RNA polymerase sigma-54 factor
MAMLQRQVQGQRLQQKADPQLLLTNRFLQMQSMELRQAVVAELGENPALESSEESGCNHCDVPGPDCFTCPYGNFSGIASSKSNGDGPLALRDLTAEEIDPFASIEAPCTLQEHLRTQLRAVVEPGDLPIGEYLIANIDDDGYLRCDAEETCRSLGVAPEAVERVVQAIQLLDPSGVGARTLQECLLIQARAHAAEGTAPPHLVPVLEQYWSELAATKFRIIARGLRTTPEQVEATVGWLRKNLCPYPGTGFRPSWKRDTGSRQSVRPDIVVELNEEDEIVLEVMDEASATISISPRYAQLWQRMRDQPESFNPAERRHVRDYLMRAQMFLKSLQDRTTILRRVAECLLGEQERYFRSEQEEDMAPITQSQLAAFLHVHESTVSRAVADKFLQLPSGRVVPLNYFFDRALSYRKLVANVVASEDPRSPYSDQEIADILRRQGVEIARRTVMKYREEMNILSSRLRARSFR